MANVGYKKKIRGADVSVKKAKKEIKEAEKFMGVAQEEVVDVAKATKGEQKQKLTSAAKDLEKAVHSAGESCEATEEAEVKVRESKNNP